MRIENEELRITNKSFITMKKRIISLCAFTLMFIAHCYAGVTLTVPDVNIVPGSTSYVVINFDLGTQPYTAYQFDIAYPEGISSVNDNTGNPQFITGDVYNGHSVSSGYAPGGQARFQCFSTNSTPFTVQSGTLLTLSIGAAKSMAEGTYQATISPIEFVQTDATPDRPDAVTFNINVTRNVVLDETSTIAPTAVTGVNVRVKRSIKANEWSTICLPFAMNTTQVKAAFGSDVALADFNDYVYDDAKDIITVKFQDAFAIEANHPYIIRVSEGITEFTVDGVDIDPVEEPKINLGFNRKPHAIVGTYVANTTLEYGTLFLNGNKFWYSVGNTKMKAFRAYFDFDDLLSDFEKNYESRIAMSFESETTGIAEIENGKLPIDNSAYDLLGRKVLKPVKGLYIRNGRKEVAK